MPATISSRGIPLEIKDITSDSAKTVHKLLILAGFCACKDMMPNSSRLISSARAIVEADFPDTEIEPSLGSHFFDNLTTFGVAYFTIHQGKGEGCIDWEWLGAQPATSEYLDGAVRHLRLQEGLQVLADGKSGRGAVVREI